MKKIRIKYYEVLLKKLMDYQFDLVKKDSTGEMLNKLIVESLQEIKRREQQLIDKVLK